MFAARSATQPLASIIICFNIMVLLQFTRMRGGKNGKKPIGALTDVIAHRSNGMSRQAAAVVVVVNVPM